MASKCKYTRVYKIKTFIQQLLRNTLKTDSNSTSTFLYFTMQLSLKLDRLERFLTWSRTKYKCMQGKRQAAVPIILVSIVAF